MWRRYLALAVILTGVIACSGCRQKHAGPTAPPSPQATPRAEGTGGAQGELAGKRILMVVAPKDFRDEEYTMPRMMFEDAGASVRVASTEAGTATGVSGAKAPVDLLASDAKAADFDAVVFVGGPGMVAHLGDADLIRLAKESAQAGKVTAAICVAPTILANAGVLKGVEATAWPDQESALKAKGAIWSSKTAVRSGKIVTANGPEAAHPFASLVIEALKDG